jgi:hypothetical protein
MITRIASALSRAFSFRLLRRPWPPRQPLRPLPVALSPPASRWPTPGDRRFVLGLPDRAAAAPGDLQGADRPGQHAQEPDHRAASAAVRQAGSGSKAPKPDQAALRQQYAQIQQIEQAGQREIQQILEPLQLSEQYVLEQIGDKLDDATQSAMTKRKIRWSRSRSSRRIRRTT